MNAVSLWFTNLTFDCVQFSIFTLGIYVYQFWFYFSRLLHELHWLPIFYFLFNFCFLPWSFKFIVLYLFNFHFWTHLLTFNFIFELLTFLNFLPLSFHFLLGFLVKWNFFSWMRFYMKNEYRQIWIEFKGMILKRIYGC